jgi:hypothetical protein
MVTGKELLSFTEIEVLRRVSSCNQVDLSIVVGELELIKCYFLQEFSKLFASMLENRLSHQSSPFVKEIVSEQFCGKYSYVTV